MVYDPIRDCDVPSPSVTRRPSLWETPPPNPPAAPGSGYLSTQQLPPAFSAERSPVPSPSLMRPPSNAGLRSILNDDAPPPRRDSLATVSSATDDEHPPSRTSISKLLNEPSPALGRPSSSHSDSASPRLSSPSISLHPGAVTQPSRVARSPLISPKATTPHGLPPSSPASAAGYPFDVQPTQPHAGPSSRRSSVDSRHERSMPPPAEPPIRHDLLRASASVSPRSHPQPLPLMRVSSRPSSSRSASGGALVPPPMPSMSPETHPRRLSEDPAHGVNGRPARRKYEPHQGVPYRPPITPDELAHLHSQAMQNNPLRRRARPPAPAWSAPSPHAEMHDSPHSRGASRRGSTASAAERPTYPSVGSDPEVTASLKRLSSNMGDSEARTTKVSRTDYTGNAAAVASHYNARPEVGLQHREYSPIIGLKKFNNWIKSVLIGKFAFRGRGGPGSGAKVLDIGCGKGGDLNKWKQARIALYVGMDIAATSVDQARERYNDLRGARFDGFFVAHDCYSRPISEALPHELQQPMYDNVSLQFCMHYAFETAAKARMMLENVSRYLRRGGFFIGTIPNSSLLLERLEEIPEGQDLVFGNACYSVAFTERRRKGIYGHEYRFYLQDAVEDVPEYIVDWDNFVSLAQEYGLELDYRKTFNDVLQEEQSSRDFGPLLGRMGVIDQNGESAMDSDQWEAANLYMAFAFRKI